MAYGLGSVTEISDCVFSDNLAGQGGGLSLTGTTNLQRVTVTRNTAAAGEGGGISVFTSSDRPVTVIDSELSHNRCLTYGGGIYGRYITLRHCEIVNNEAGVPGNNLNAGGGGVAGDETLILEGNYIADNKAKDQGGGISSDLGGSGPRTITGNTIVRNQGGRHGGGIYARADYPSVTWSIANNVIEDNTAEIGGGLMVTGDFAVPVLDNRIVSNHASADGGGIWINLEDAVFHFEQNLIDENTATGDGGGIWAVNDRGTLEIVDNDLIGNVAGGDGGGLFVKDRNIYSSGPTKIDRNRIISNVAAAGGGVAIVSASTEHVVEVTNTSIEKNTASSGGGGLAISASLGKVLLSASTVAENQTTQSYAAGGGILVQNLGAEVVISNSTISSNKTQGGAGGGIHWFSSAGTSRIEHTTVAQNNAQTPFGIGGGIFLAGGSLQIDHSLLARNSAGANLAPDLYSTTGIAISHSLIQDNNGSGLATAPATAPDANGNIVGGTGVGVSINLGPLSSNGGLTRTHTLLAGSAAINAGAADFAPPPERDQRGGMFQRVAGGRIDIGAVERQLLVGTDFLVDSLSDEDDGDYTPGNFTLREAIRRANESVSTLDTIHFDPSLFAGGPATIVLSLGELKIHNPLSIVGPGAQMLTIDASGNDPTPTANNGDGSRIFNVDDGLNAELIHVTMSDLSLTGGDAAINGGAIFSRENLSIVRSQLHGNSTNINQRGTGGGAIYSETPQNGPIATLAIMDSSLFSNTAARADGGGILSRNSKLIIERSMISANTAQQSGAGISASSGTVQINASTIHKNSANEWGGGLYAFGASVSLVNSTISENSAALLGGGIFLWQTRPSTIESCTISGNSSIEGGGIFNSASSLKVRHTTITRNISSFGGGILSTESPSARTELYSSIVAGNTNEDLGLLFGPAISYISNGYNLIGVGAGAAAFNQPGDQVSITDPRLAFLTNNGGPTRTHALLAGSPALDSGDPSFSPPPTSDQRGLSRVVHGGSSPRIDVGAFEAQAAPPALPGDYNNNGVVDAADYSVWRDALGQTDVSPYCDADGSGNGTIDEADYLVWRSFFGHTLAGSAAIDRVRIESESHVALTVPEDIVDSVVAYRDNTQSFVAPPPSSLSSYKSVSSYGRRPHTPHATMRDLGSLDLALIAWRSLPWSASQPLDSSDSMFPRDVESCKVSTQLDVCAVDAALTLLGI